MDSVTCVQHPKLGHHYCATGRLITGREWQRQHLHDSENASSLFRKYTYEVQTSTHLATSLAETPTTAKSGPDFNSFSNLVLIRPACWLFIEAERMGIRTYKERQLALELAVAHPGVGNEDVDS
ncbi:hypothetical protein WAI453_004473 [Rhynchosporium graminicola]